MMRRTALLGAACGVALTAMTLPAVAAWVFGGSAIGTGAAGTLGSPDLGSSTSTSSSVTLNWSPPAGTAPDGYLVTRTSPAPAVQVCSTTTTTTCTDSSLNSSTTYSYSVVATKALWRSGASTTTVTTPAPFTMTEPGQYVNATRPTISGTGSDGTVSVKIYSGATAGGTVLQTLSPTAASGSWTVTPAALTTANQYTATATQGGRTLSRTFIVDTAAPALTLTAQRSGANGDMGAIGSTSTTASPDSGTVTVNVYAGTATTGTPVLTPVVTYGTRGPGGATKTWSVTYSGLTKNAGYTVVATQTDGAANIAIQSAPFTAN